MTTLQERIRWVLSEYGLTQRELANIAGVRQPSVNRWATGAALTISAESAANICARLPINLDWLIQGVGSPKRSDAPARPGKVKSFIPTEEPPPDGVIAIPEYRLTLSAGPGNEADWEEVNDSEDYWYRRSFFQKRRLNPERCRRARVNGDSMEPRIRDGDRVLWCQEIDPRPGCVAINDGSIYVISVHGEMRVKRLSRVKGGIRITSDNPDYPVEVYLGDECDDIRIYGRVYEITSEA